MKKIEPALLQFRIDENGTKSKWVRIVGTSEETIKAFGTIYEVRQLWTDDALQAVAEAVQQACAVACIENDGAVPQVDLAAIINQLKGK